MIPAGVDIVGVQCVELDDDALVVRLALSDGSTCASHWDTASLREFMHVVSAPTHAPAGALVQ